MRIDLIRRERGIEMQSEKGKSVPKYPLSEHSNGHLRLQ
jgi:hypothetical protein